VLGTTPDTCSAADPSGNNTSCATSVTVVDTTPPSIECSPSKTIFTADQGGACTASTSISATASDICSGSLSADCDSSSLSLSAPGSAAATCSTVDGSGNDSSCSTSLTLVDNTPPAITCPPSQTIECASPNGTQ